MSYCLPYISEEAVLELDTMYKDKSPAELRGLIKQTELSLAGLEALLKYRGKLNHPKPRYTFKTVPAIGFHGESMPGSIIVIGTCVNYDEVEKHLNDYGTSATWDKSLHSVVYYRMNGLLLHQHGGHLILKALANDRFGDMPLPCTDAQWEQLLNGTVPTEMLQSYYC